MPELKAVPAPGSAASPVRACPLCAGSRSRLFQRITLKHGRCPGTFELRRCLDCGLTFVDPRPDDASLAALYDEEFYFSGDGPYAGIAEQVFALIQSTRQRRVERYVRGGRLLDIGSGDGRFVHHMAGHGWQATGIDFSPAAQTLAHSQSNGGRFLYGSLADHRFDAASFDLVTMWQVLEHIGDPRDLFRRCHAMLRPGGVFVASVPNIDGLSSRLTGERWWGLDVPRHLVHYSPRTLRHGLEGAGFELLKINHLSLQYDPYALLHSSLDWVFTRRHFLSDLAKRQLPSDLPAHERAYNIAALTVLGPVLAPLSVVTTLTGAWLGCGGFIEVFARRK